ncbi:MAG TPA: hypothetical protein VGE93_01495 [Bryobacteraceae bacterium]
MKRNQWAATSLAVLLFCLGATVGALAERYYHATVVDAKTAEDWREIYVREMKSKLKLNDGQVRQLEAILDQTKARYKAVRDSYRPAMLKVKEEQINEVKSILSPEQVPVYEKLVAEREQRHREQEARDQKKEQEQEAKRRKAGG